MGSPIEDQGARKLLSVTPHDTNNQNLSGCRALWIGVAGNVAIIAEDDTAAVTLVGVSIGLLPVKAKRVMATNTTATTIVALF
jgi:hypothetical protein